jgi:hypothetical protein
LHSNPRHSLPEQLLTFFLLQRHFAIISDENDQEDVRRRNARGKIVKLPNATIIVLKNLFEVLRFINKDKMKYLDDYRCEKNYFLAFIFAKSIALYEVQCSREENIDCLCHLAQK